MCEFESRVSFVVSGLDFARLRNLHLPVESATHSHHRSICYDPCAVPSSRSPTSCQTGCIPATGNHKTLSESQIIQRVLLKFLMTYCVIGTQVTRGNDHAFNSGKRLQLNRINSESFFFHDSHDRWQMGARSDE